MTPGARLSAAIEILDAVLDGAPAGVTLARWGRGARYAGSKDRNAIRDLVFDCLRKKRSLAHRGGAETGRALILAHAFEAGTDLDTVFSGEGYHPAAVTPTETAALNDGRTAVDPVRLNYPDFLDDAFRRSLGESFEPVMAAMATRAPVDLRVNRQKASLVDAQAALAAEEIETLPVEGVATALRVITNPRRVASSRAYKDGLVELQDASSQAAALFAGAKPGMRVLDYCAGGGGKALALYDAIGGEGAVFAHDIATVRMNDLPARAARAGARIRVVAPDDDALATETFDLVFVDAPCSGTGAWRRTPDAKWRVTADDLARLEGVQADILGVSICGAVGC